MACIRTNVVLYYFLFYLATSRTEDDVGIDYLFGNDVLRSPDYPQENACNDAMFNYFCQMKCEGSNVCHQNRCYCLTVYEPEDLDLLFEGNQDDGLKHYQLEHWRLPLQIPYENKESSEILPIEEYEPRPLLRHHIAHFCPNLDEARVCIRKCMQFGKPAFCGKDHVCYCGHKTDRPMPPLDAEEVYGNFRDLYAKYFKGKTNDDEHLDIKT